MKKWSFVLAAMAMASLTACGSSGSGQSTAAAELKEAENSEQASSTAAETTAQDEAAAGEAKQESASAEDTAQEAADGGAGGTFIVGFDQEFPPMGFIGDDGEYTGFDLDLAKEVAKRLGLEYKAQPIAWDSKDMELASGNIDCIWNGFTMTGREDDYTWSEPYMENAQVFVVKKDSGIKSQADLAGKNVEVQMDSSGQKALEAEADLSATFGQLVTTPDYNTAFMDLEQGAVDAICMDTIVAAYQIKSRNADMEILPDSLSAEVYAVGFKKGNTELRDKVNATLEEMAADGTLAKISDEWFGEDVTTIGK